MNHRTTHIIIFLLVFCSISGFASKQDEQKINHQKTILLGGDVFDSFIRNLPVKAKVTLMNEDSLIIDTTTCRIRDIYSSYSFHVPAVEKKYIIKCALQWRVIYVNQ